jgi:hypothetical protein
MILAITFCATFFLVMAVSLAIIASKPVPVPEIETLPDYAIKYYLEPVSAAQLEDWRTGRWQD